MTDQENSHFRSGYIAIVGRPNVGKSTLMNELIGAKVSITSRKAQTTRHRIMGIQTDEDTQFIYIDTPGFQTRYNNALNKTLNKTVTNTLTSADVILFVVDADVFGQADQQVLDLIPKKVPTILVINKTDKVKDKKDLMPFAEKVSALRDFAAIVPVSARQRFQLDRLENEIRHFLPENPPMFDPEDVTDRSERFMAAEIIREKICRVLAAVLVERDAHKAMIIGHKGEKLKEISTEARLDMEKMFGVPVYLEIWVKVKSGWADNEAGLRAYGYD